ncbi:MAG: HAMP domain-containing sensor histidine kinase, partial [Bacteroidota bacterium]
RNEELDAFAHTVAHDLRTPLGSIIGFAEILKDSYGFMPKEESLEFLTHILNSGNKTLQILNSLLLLTNVRKAEAPSEKLDMKDIVGETIKRLSDDVSQFDVKIIHPASWPEAIGYAPWVEEIWVNYINNAIKYGGESPEIQIGADIITSDNNIEMVRFWVRDKGIGITDENQKLLFQQFERLHQAKIEGHGLGLSIVRRIAHRLGGHVGVESEVGKGSLFYFTLPKS